MVREANVPGGCLTRTVLLMLLMSGQLHAVVPLYVGAHVGRCKPRQRDSLALHEIDCQGKPI